MVKEMVGGCCVCSDEQGSPENPLVYCDGEGCTVAVHQACYGIVAVPQGPWFCRKCESQERAARVRCELCPQRDGALKKCDNGGWAHVVCALYIPEVRFGNVATMEPIMINSIPNERFHKKCYICEEAGKESKASIGACMQCNKNNCKNYFHVTCAQAKGLLCEEMGNYGHDAVKYCGYCSHHYNKILNSSEKVMSKDSKRFTLVASRKDYPTIKPIPAFKSIPSDRDRSPDSSPDKKSPATSKDKDKDRDHHRSTPSSSACSSSHKDKESNGLKSKKKEISKGPLLDKEKKKDSLSKDKEKEKLTEAERLTKEKEKEIISSRPVDERPAGGQFSLSAFINPNLANKKTLQQNQLSFSGSQKLTDSSKLESTKNSSSSKSSLLSLESKNTKSSSSLSSSSSAPKVDRAAALFDAVVGKPPMKVTSGDKSSSKDLEKNKTNKDKRKVDSKNSLDSKASSILNKEGKSGSLLNLATSILGTSLEKKSEKKPPPKESHRRVSDSTSDDERPVNKKSRLASALSSSSSSLDMDDEPVVEKKVVKRKSSSTNKSSSKVSQGGGKESGKKYPLPTLFSSKSASSPGRAAKSETLPVNGTGKKGSSSIGRKRKAPPPVKSASKSSPKSRAIIVDDYDDDESKDDDVSSNGTEPNVDDDLEVRSSSTGVTPSSKRSSPSVRQLRRGSSDTSSSSLEAGGGTPSKLSKVSGGGNVTASSSASRATASITERGVKGSSSSHLSNAFSSSSTKKNGFLPSPSPSLTPTTNRKASMGHSVDVAFAHPRPPSKSVARTPPIDPTEPPATSLEALLERQWAQGSQFIMDQAAHYDIASLLSCLSQLRNDNERLEDRLRQLTGRREHLLAVNARLALPLNGSIAGALGQIPGLTTSQLVTQHGASSSFLAPHAPSSLHHPHHLPVLASGGASAVSAVSTTSSSTTSSSFDHRRPSTDTLSMNGILGGVGGRHDSHGLSISVSSSLYNSTGSLTGGFHLPSSLRSTPSPRTTSSSSFLSSTSPFTSSSVAGATNSPLIHTGPLSSSFTHGSSTSSSLSSTTGGLGNTASLNSLSHKR